MKVAGIYNMGVTFMNITKSCFNCGGVLFSIIPETGNYQAVCSECGAIIGGAQLDKYMTIKDTCTNCNCSKFKIKVTKVEDEENWGLECFQCRAEPAYVYVDKDLNEIDEKTRENFILKDIIYELQEKINDLEKRFE